MQCLLPALWWWSAAKLDTPRHTNARATWIYGSMKIMAAVGLDSQSSCPKRHVAAVPPEEKRKERGEKKEDAGKRAEKEPQGEKEKDKTRMEPKGEKRRAGCHKAHY